MNIMFDESFPVAKQELPVSLKQDNVIFVFEDVDAASKIVQARRSNNSSSNGVRASARRPKGRGRSKSSNKKFGAAKGGQRLGGGKEEDKDGIEDSANENEVRKKTASRAMFREGVGGEYGKRRSLPWCSDKIISLLTPRKQCGLSNAGHSVSLSALGMPGFSIVPLRVPSLVSVCVTLLSPDLTAW